jgi:thioredoxin reductase (NADPH)
MRRKEVGIWSVVAFVFIGVSVAVANWLTRPNEGVERQTIAVVYARERSAQNVEATLRFARRDASEIELDVQPRKVPFTFIFAVSGATGCRRKAGSEGQPRVLNAAMMSPNNAAGPEFDAIRAYLVMTKLRDASMVCTLKSGATTAAYSVRRFALASSGRYVNAKTDDAGCLSFSSTAYCPVSTYRVEFDGIPNLADLRTDGGVEIPGSPRARSLVASSALVHVQWKNESEDYVREFMLFVAAGVFALGLATVLEAIKAALSPVAGLAGGGPLAERTAAMRTGRNPARVEEGAMPAPTHAKVVIIGSGPAGLTAAVYAARANLAPIVFAGHMYGGQLMLTTEVENYPGFADGIMGPELMEAFRAQAERFGSVIHNVDVTEVDFAARPFVVRTDEDAYTADSVIIATGASARWLNIPGEARLRGRGVSTCATCDGAFFRDKHIVVVGGGDSAMEEALFLTRFGRQVTVIHRRDSLRASKIMAERALNHEKIAFVWNTAVEEVIGEDNTTALRLKNLVTGEESVLAADALFIAIGHDPNTAIFRGQITLDAAGYIVSDDGVRTNVEGVFVAGDVYDIRYKQAVTAAGSGCKAAIDVEKYLESLESHHKAASPEAALPVSA